MVPVTVILAAAIFAGAEPAGVDLERGKAGTSLSEIPDSVAINNIRSAGSVLMDSLQTTGKSQSPLMSLLRLRRPGTHAGRITSAWPDNMSVVFPDTTGFHMKVIVPMHRHFPMPILTPKGWQGAGEKAIDSVSSETPDSTLGAE